MDFLEIILKLCHNLATYFVASGFGLMNVFQQEEQFFSSSSKEIQKRVKKYTELELIANLIANLFCSASFLRDVLCTFGRYKVVKMVHDCENFFEQKHVVKKGLTP